MFCCRWHNGRFTPLITPKIGRSHPDHWDLSYADSDRFTLIGQGAIWNWLPNAAPVDHWHHFQQQFLADGLDFVAQLGGQFCFVLHDKQQQTTYAFRDQVGTYPLYYSQTTTGLLLASRLSELRPWLPSLALSISGAAHFFRFGYVHAPHTLLQNVCKLLPGECLIGDAAGRWQTRRYWTVPAHAPQAKSPDEFLQETRELVAEVLAKHINGRSELGLFLSGGIDSSILLAVLVNQFGLRPHTYTFGLNVVYKRANYLRDLPFAREMATVAGVCHHEHLIDTQFPVAELLLELLPQLDSLLITPNVVTKYWLAKQAAAQGVTTLLTGSASIGGFDAFSEASLRKKQFDPKRPFAEMVPTFRRNVLAPQQIHALLPAAADLPPTFFNDALQPYWEGVPTADPAYALEAGLFAASTAEKGLPVHLDLGRQLGVEFKLPLADSAFVQFKTTVPRYLLAGNANFVDKFLLKEAFKAWVPASICQRHSGVGFPSYYWFQGELEPLQRQLFAPDWLQQVPELETAVLHQIVTAEQQSTRKSKGKLSWGLTVFLLWYQHFIKGQPLNDLLRK